MAEINLRNPHCVTARCLVFVGLCFYVSLLKFRHSLLAEVSNSVLCPFSALMTFSCPLLLRQGEEPLGLNLKRFKPWKCKRMTLPRGYPVTGMTLGFFQLFAGCMVKAGWKRRMYRGLVAWQNVVMDNIVFTRYGSQATLYALMMPCCNGLLHPIYTTPFTSRCLSLLTHLDIFDVCAFIISQGRPWSKLNGPMAQHWWGRLPWRVCF